MKYYPLYLDIRERPCVVIGGGPVAERKTISLLEAGADVTLVSPTLTPKLQELSGSGKITYIPRPCEEKDLTGALIVIAATDSPEINSTVSRWCRKKQILVNVVSPPEETCFIVPSVIERGDLLIAVSTCGISPALSRKLRRDLEKQYGPEYEVLLRKLEIVRKRLRDQVPDETERRARLQAIIDSDVLDLLREKKIHEAESRMWEIAGLN